MIAAAARLLCAMAVLLGSLVLFGSPAQACSCAAADTTTHVGWADQVFTGSVISSRSTGGPSGQIIFEVEVDRRFKGEVSASIQVATAASSAACGLGNIAEGTPYAFFTASAGTGGRAGPVAVEDVVHTGLCSGTTASTALIVKRIETVTGAGTSPGPAATAATDPQTAPASGTGNGAGKADVSGDGGNGDGVSGGGGGAPLWPFVTGLVVVALAAGAWTARRTP